MLYENLGKQFAITEEQYAAVCRWVESNFLPRKTINYERHLGGIKHVFETEPGGFYVHNDVIRDALTECGYHTKQDKFGTWFLNISEKSQAVKNWLR